MSFSRRQLIRAGALGCGGLSLSSLLGAEEQGAVGSAKSVILLVLNGGLGQHETFDPKPLAPREIRGQYAAIQTRTPGVLVSEMLPELAQRSDKFCLIRSMSHINPVHVAATHMMLSGQPNGTLADDSPYIGSLVARFKPTEVAMPSYVWLLNMRTGTNKEAKYGSGLRSVGQQYAPLRIGDELDNPSSPNFRVSHFDPPQGATPQQLQQRIELLKQLDVRPDISLAQKQFDKYQQRAAEMVSGPEARRAFSLEDEPPEVRDRYGRNPLGQNLLLSRRLVEAGVRLVTVTGWPGLAPGETVPQILQVWDMHDQHFFGHDHMYGNGPYGMQWSLPRLDQGLSALLDDLQDRGLLDETLVVAVSEFGRTPKFEGKGRGRGHWPHAYSTLMAGGGVKPGLVYGASDKVAGYVASGRPVSQTDLAATIFHALGIPRDAQYGSEGFSLRVNNGTPLTDIFV